VEQLGISGKKNLSYLNGVLFLCLKHLSPFVTSILPCVFFEIEDTAQKKGKHWLEKNASAMVMLFF